MEKLLTTTTKDLARFRKDAPEEAVSHHERNAREAYHYTKVSFKKSLFSIYHLTEEETQTDEEIDLKQGSSLLMRSQLDGVDPRLPGNGSFDIKTRSTIAIRMDMENVEVSLPAISLLLLLSLDQIAEPDVFLFFVFVSPGRTSLPSSLPSRSSRVLRKGTIRYVPICFPQVQVRLTRLLPSRFPFRLRHVADLSLCRFLFFFLSLQCRIGGMDGIFVAYHTTSVMHGFQYIPVDEMDEVLFGSTTMGDQNFALSVEILEKVFEMATTLYPGVVSSIIILRSISEEGREEIWQREES